MNVGFIGLGTMGAPMARNALAKGHALVVHDVAAASVAALVAAGARAAATPKEVAAQSDVVITMLPTGPIVRQAVLPFIPGALAKSLAAAVTVRLVSR